MLSAITRINSCIGLSIRRVPEGFRISGISVSRNGNQLDLGKRLKDAHLLKGLREEFLKDTHLALNLSGKGVVTKKVAKTADGLFVDFDKIAPGAERSDFYIQEFNAAEHSFVSFIRKSEADEIISGLTDQGFQVMMLTLAGIPVIQVAEQLNQYDQSIILDGHELSRDERGSWDDYKFSDNAHATFPVKLGLETLDEQLVLPYASAFQALLYQQIEVLEAEHPVVSRIRKRFRQMADLKKKGIILLGIFFLLLFANTLVFVELNRSNAQLQEQLSQLSTAEADLDAIADKTNANEKLVGLMGYDRNHKKSVMIDQLAALMPEGIKISIIDINAIAGKNGIKVNGPIFLDHTIAINGNSASILPVNEWLARMRSLPWVKAAELKDYGLNNSENAGAFTIIIQF